VGYQPLPISTGGNVAHSARRLDVGDGRVTFARRLHQSTDPQLASTPIVLLTAVPNAAQLQREVGALAVIEKPVSFDNVAAMVARHCAGSAGTRS
jgi:CheY-like chemotaxis protein